MTCDLTSLGWDAYFAGGYAGYDRPSRRPARVMRVDRGVCTVLAASGAARASLAGAVLAAAADDRSALPCPGDWVVVHTWADHRVTVEAVLPRRTAVPGRDGRVLAANLDLAGVVVALDAPPDAGPMRRLLALAAASGAAPMLILTRADAVPSPAAVADRLAAVAAGVPVHWVSARTGDGLADLRRHVPPGRTLGLLVAPDAARGGSLVAPDAARGASLVAPDADRRSLVEALAGAPVVATQARRADGRRRVAVLPCTLMPLPGGGVVLDVPAVPAAGETDGEEDADPVTAVPGGRAPAVPVRPAAAVPAGRVPGPRPGRIAR